MTQANREKFMTTTTPEPIFLGSNENIGPYMIIRYIDTQHNKAQEFPATTTSFACLTIAPIAHVGLELMLIECQFIKDPETGQINVTGNPHMGLDGGASVIERVIALIEGKLEGKQIR
jgi:hypothetical protein